MFPHAASYVARRLIAQAHGRLQQCAAHPDYNGYLVFLLARSEVITYIAFEHNREQPTVLSVM